MLILGIETSCDETAIAVVKNGFIVLSSIVKSQIPTHSLYGGVIPELAAREHLNVINYLCEEALNKADLQLKDIDVIAVTQGPGLVGSLIVGASYAKGLACGLNIPLIRVDHVKAHIFSAFLNKNDIDFDLILPALALVVSGGHTNLYYMNDLSTLYLIGYTLDDACGECFDKVAKMLGLSYPGGSQIENFAKNGNNKSFVMPQIKHKTNSLMFSYSGLKTHMFNLIQQLGESQVHQHINDICASFQHAALMQIIKKLKIALKTHQKTKSIIIGGGVSANQYFKNLLKEYFTIPILFPQLEYCSDNGAMISSYAYFIFKSLNPNANSCFEPWDVYSKYNFYTD